MVEKEKSSADDVLINSSDPTQSIEYINTYLAEKQQALQALGDNADVLEQVRLKLDIAQAMVGVNRSDESWELARTAIDVFIEHECWQEAVQACDVLYQSNQPASLTALAHGVWLGVTFPIDPQLSINMLGYIVDETPGTADGAAVAAITAHYIADVRTQGKVHESLTFLTNEMVANVAREHSGVEDQAAMTVWMERLELHDPDIFLPRLSLVINAIVPQEQWWFDRDVLREKIPG